MTKGLFVTFEGPDGSGKTTLSTRVCEILESRGVDSLYSREPGGSKVSEKIRAIILDPKNTEMDDRTEALLYAASRRQNVVENIRPALQAGRLVICDRFIDSSLAYQGYGRRIGFNEVLELNRFAVEDTMPDVTYFLDIDYQTGLERINQGRTALDRLELEDNQFHRDVYEGYQEVLAYFRQRMVIIDGTKPIEENAQWVVDDILKRAA